MDESELPRVLTAIQAGACGVTTSYVRTQLRRRRWRRLATGVVFTRPDPPDRADWAMAGLALAGAQAALSGWDALALRGVGGRTPSHPQVLVLTRHGRHRVVGGVRLRPTHRPYSVRYTAAIDPVLPLVPVVSTARAVCDAATGVPSLATARALVASAVQRQLCTVEDIMCEACSLPRNGTGFLRRAMTEASDGARSVAEAHAADRLKRARLPTFELNAVVVDAERFVRYVVDFLWRSLRAVLEIDSREFHFSAADWAATTARHNALISLGYSVVHYPPSAVDQPEWAAEVRRWLRRRAVDLGVPWPPP